MASTNMPRNTKMIFLPGVNILTMNVQQMGFKHIAHLPGIVNDCPSDDEPTVHLVNMVPTYPRRHCYFVWANNSSKPCFYAHYVLRSWRLLMYYEKGFNPVPAFTDRHPYRAGGGRRGDPIYPAAAAGRSGRYGVV